MCNRKILAYFIFLILFWGSIVYLFNLKQYSAGYIICALIIIVYFFHKDLMFKFLFVFSALPFQAITKIAIGIPSVSVFLCACFVAEYLFVYKLFFREKIVISLFVIALLQLFAYTFWGLDFKSMISTILMILFSIAAVEYFQAINSSTVSFFRCTIVYCASLFVDILSCVIFPNLPYYIFYEKQIQLDRIGRFCALNADPNYFGQLSLIGISFLFANSFYNFKNKRYLFASFFLLVLSFFVYYGIMSLSKGFIISLGGITIFAVWYIVTYNTSKGSKFLSIILFFLIVYPLADFLYKYLVLPIIEARSETDFFTGRTEKWIMYFNVLSQYPIIFLTGCGCGNSQSFFVIHSGYLASSHNMYIDILFEYGFLGFTMLSIVWSRLYKLLFLIFNNPSLLFVWALLFSSFSLSVSANDVIYFLVPLCYIIIQGTDHTHSEQVTLNII